jgi:hypothetical protein
VGGTPNKETPGIWAYWIFRNNRKARSSEAAEFNWLVEIRN